MVSKRGIWMVLVCCFVLSLTACAGRHEVQTDVDLYDPPEHIWWDCSDGAAEELAYMQRVLKKNKWESDDLRHAKDSLEGCSGIRATGLHMNSCWTGWYTRVSDRKLFKQDVENWQAWSQAVINQQKQVSE